MLRKYNDTPRGVARAGLAALVPAVLAFLPAPVLAEDGFDGWGSVRVRAQAIANRVQPQGARDDQAVQLRTILGGAYRKGRLTLTGELRDSRSYGQERDSAVDGSDVNTLEPVQYNAALALGEAEDEGTGATVTVGRMLFEMGSDRIISQSNWGNVTTSFTGAKADLHDKDGRRASLFWVMPGQRIPSDAEAIRDNEPRWDRESPQVHLFGAWASLPLVKDVALELYAYRLDESDRAGRPTANRRLLTPGIRLRRKPQTGAFDFDLEAIGQWGRVRASRSDADRTDLEVAASFFHGEAGYSFAHPWKPRLAFLFERGSGDRAGGRYTRFDHLYGSRSEFHPTSFYGPLNRSNIVSPGFRLSGAPDERTSVWLTGRALWLESASDSFAQTGVRDKAGASGRFAGHQIEGAVKHKLPGGWMVEAGGAYLVRGGFLNDAPNARPGGNTLFGYTDLSFSF